VINLQDQLVESAGGIDGDVNAVRTISAARRKISTDLESSLNVSWYFFRQKLSDCSSWAFLLCRDKLK